MKKKKEEKTYPKLTFEVREEGTIVVGCMWDTPESAEEAASIVEGLSKLVFLSTTGKLLSATQQAIAGFDPEDEVNQKIARAILGAINVLADANGIARFNPNKPVVSPRNCFSVRGGGND